MKIKVSKRLAVIANYVDAKRVADVGCDHGKLMELLFENSVINYALLSDISEPSVLKGVKLLTDNKRNFDYVVADGLMGITTNHKIEQVVIAGMGGLEIIKILQDNPTQIQNFVLQPQNNELLLKEYLIKNKYEIINDIIVCDKSIFYNIIKVQKSNKKQRISKYNKLFGKDNFVNNDDFSKYLLYLKDKYEKILLSVPKLQKGTIKSTLKLIKKAIKERG